MNDLVIKFSGMAFSYEISPNSNSSLYILTQNFAFIHEFLKITVLWSELLLSLNEGYLIRS